MPQRREQLRQAVGEALRHLRTQGHFSLDEIQRQTAEVGVRVTRSHLSRVETGQAELTLSRFLALLRTLGENAFPVLDRLEALLDKDQDRASLLKQAREAQKRGEVHLAARFFRSAFSSPTQEDLGECAGLWARAEAALGRWEAVERLLGRLQAPLGTDSTPLFLGLAVACLGRANPALALGLARGAGRKGLSELVASACYLASGNVRRADEGACAASAEAREIQGLAGIVVAEARRQAGFCRGAVEAALKAAEQARPGAERIEAWLVLARSYGDVRRPAAGLSILAKGSHQAREAGLPELLARCHLEAQRLWKLEGQPKEAREAGRAARALLTRIGADRRTPRHLPLQGLFSSAAAGLDHLLEPEQGGKIAHALQTNIGLDPQADDRHPRGPSGGDVQSGVADQHNLAGVDFKTLQGQKDQIRGRFSPGYFVPSGDDSD